MRNQKESNVKTKKLEKINRSQTENLSTTVEAEVTMVLMQNQKASDMKTMKSKKLIEVKPKIYAQRQKKK